MTLDQRFYLGAAIGFADLVVIALIVVAGIIAFRSSSNEQKQRWSAIGIVSAATLIVLVHIHIF